MTHRPRPPAAAGTDTAPDPLPIMPPEEGIELFSDNHVEPRRASAVMPFAAPLLPPQHPVQPIGLEKRDPEPRRIDRGAPVEETTEVHVSIGRIEVTAVHEAPPAPQRQPPRTKPMSLEQYLARRRGGGS